MNLKQIGIRVRKRRKELHITIEKLAELSEISVSSISLLERGRLTDIHFNNLCNIANALEVDLFYLISNNDNTSLELRKLNNVISKYSKEKQHDIIQAILCLLNTK
ncbi:helix-turn-helix domain-containing protein [Ligilactobacillus sp. LYQ135]